MSATRGPREKRRMRQCPMCGIPWNDGGAKSFGEHVRDVHERDAGALAWNLEREINARLNRNLRKVNR